MIIEDQGAQIAFLSDPLSYAEGMDKVERIETHGALVFLAGDRAYKLKRAVRFPYMDFSTSERRRRLSYAEVVINRRTAPAMYLEVRPIVRGEGGKLAFGPADDATSEPDWSSGGDSIDWVVVMRRFDQATQFDHLAAAGRLDADLVRALADEIARFHQAAELQHGFGSAQSYEQLIAGIGAEFNRHAGTCLDPDAIRKWLDEARQRLARCAPVIEARRGAGHVRRCHGDLHLANICMFDGKPTPFDAIEFNDEFACTDTFYDLAFLIMDLDRYELRTQAAAVLNRYLERRPEDLPALAALPLFLSCRAAIRAHVAASTAATPTLAPAESAAKRDEARLYLARALGYLQPPAPRLIAIAGPSGTGKTTLARLVASHLGAAPGAVIPRSDVIRKQLMGVEETTALPSHAYTSTVSDRVFVELERRAGVALAAGHSVIADAVFGTAARRRSLGAVAARAGVAFSGIWLNAPQAKLEARVAARRGDASDATVEVVRRQIAETRPPGPDEPDWRIFDASGSPDQLAVRVRAALKLT